MFKRSLISIAALVMLTSNSFAFCYEQTVNTPNINPVNHVGAVVGGAGSTRQGNMSSTLRVCTDPNSTHRFAKAMHLNGSCDANGYEWSTGAGPVTYSEQVKFVTLDGDVPDYDQRRYGIFSPINIPAIPPFGHFPGSPAIAKGDWVGTAWQGGPGNNKYC